MFNRSTDGLMVYLSSVRPMALSYVADRQNRFAVRPLDRWPFIYNFFNFGRLTDWEYSTPLKGKRIKTVTFNGGWISGMEILPLN